MDIVVTVIGLMRHHIDLTIIILMELEGVLGHSDLVTAAAIAEGLVPSVEAIVAGHADRKRMRYKLHRVQGPGIRPGWNDQRRTQEVDQISFDHRCLIQCDLVRFL